jgi:hypothetical protein
MRKLIPILIILTIVSPVFAEEVIVFSGIPQLKISEGGLNRVPENLTSERALKVRCTVAKVDNKFFWKSRENIELIPIESGTFITYLAANGSGYVRIIKPELKGEVKKFGAAVGDPEGTFDYVEHLLLGLKSVTYYGLSK